MRDAVQARRYYAHVEGLRGVAALYVFLFHLWNTGTMQGAALAPLRGTTSFLQYGHYAVVAFIVISGYCLGLPVAARPGHAFRVRDFFVRRARRLMPAYVAALALSVVIVLATNALRGHHIPAWHLFVGVVAHLALVHNLVPALAEYINGPMWSIALECQIYVVFALLLVPVWRRFGPFAQLALALALGLAPHFLFHGALDAAVPWLLGLFAMGVVAAQLTARPQPSRVPWRAVSAGAGVVALVVVALNGQSTPDGALWLPDLVAGAALALFLIASVDRAGVVARVLAARPVVFLGTFSYSLYLLHGPAVEFTGEALTRAHAGAALSAGAYAALTALVLAGAYAFYRLVERPFMSPQLRAALDVETSDRPLPRGAEAEHPPEYSPA